VRLGWGKNPILKFLEPMGLGLLRRSRISTAFLVQNDSGRIEFIVFTYREVFESYKGILHYEDYTLLNGRLFPMRISVKSEFSDESYIHQLQIGTLKSIPSPSFQRNINIP
jgi:hypothetical protein